jgi:cytochrome c-type biogenesis protein CcmI
VIGVGLFFTLLTLPVSGPVGGTLWIAEQVQAVAEREYYDEATIRGHLADLDERFAAGELAEDEYETAVDELFERLLEARAYWAEQEVEPVDEERSDA